MFPPKSVISPWVAHVKFNVVFYIVPSLFLSSVTFQWQRTHKTILHCLKHFSPLLHAINPNCEFHLHPCHLQACSFSWFFADSSSYTYPQKLWCTPGLRPGFPFLSNSLSSLTNGLNAKYVLKMPPDLTLSLNFSLPFLPVLLPKRQCRIEVRMDPIETEWLDFNPYSATCLFQDFRKLWELFPHLWNGNKHS